MTEYPIINGMMGHLPRDNTADFGTYNIESCSICRELNHNKNIIDSSKNFVSFPDIGQIVEGYIQIATQKHKIDTTNFYSIGHLPLSWMQELEEFVYSMKRRVEKEYGRAIIFEHGEASPVKKDDRVATVHMHLHIVPAHESILERISNSDLFSIQEINNYNELMKPISDGLPYYFYEDVDGKRYLMYFEGELPSQILRKFVNDIGWICNNNQDWIKKNDSGINPAECWECMLFRPADRFYSTVKKLRGELND